MKNRLYKLAAALIAVPFMIMAAVLTCAIAIVIPFVALIKPDWITLKTDSHKNHKK